MLKYILLLFPILSFASLQKETDDVINEWNLASPNKKISCTITLDKSRRVSYKVLSKSNNETTEIVESSPLGIEREDQNFDGLTFIGLEKPLKIKTNYTLSSGKQLVNTNHFIEQTFHFVNGNGSKIDIVFRAYNDGIAFKYVFPETDQKIYTVTKELSGFNLPEAGKAWIQPYDKASDYSPAYERNYEKEISVGTNAPSEDGWAFPALFETNKHWILLTEANLNEHFYGSHLNQNAANGLYTLTHPNAEEALGYGTVTASSTLPWNMPWRVIIIGNTLATIVESNLVNHLCDDTKLKDVSWIEPGRASWAWWSGYLDKTNDTPEKLKKFIDFAQTMQWEYSMIDAGWESRDGLNVQELIHYAKNKGVDLLLWYNSGGPTNKVDAGPRDLMFDAAIRRNEMKRISDLGIKGIKIDFFGSDKQELIKLYIEILKDAADYQLLVNFHGCTLPRGWSKTYPHLISMEAVKGSEGYIYHSDFEDNAPIQNAILPFTRNVVGPMDYTPTAFSKQQFPHKTTFAHELALSVVFESGIQHYPDTPDSYLALPIEVQNFLKELPSVWDETKLLSGYPGKDVVISRKNNNDWYLGGINGETNSKEIEVDFNFLQKGNYEVKIISDGKDKSDFAISQKQVSNASKIKIMMKPNGGFVMKLKKIKK